MRLDDLKNDLERLKEKLTSNDFNSIAKNVGISDFSEIKGKGKLKDPMIDAIIKKISSLTESKKNELNKTIVVLKAKFIGLYLRKPNEILTDAIENILFRYEKTSDLSKLADTKFSEVIVEIEQEAHELYKKEEIEAIKHLVSELKHLVSEIDPFINEISEIIPDLSTSIANTRRVRGGQTSQNILYRVLKARGIPCEIVTRDILGYRLDLAVPSVKALNENPEKAVAIASKRTLRERWAIDIRVFELFTHGKFVLVTPDEKFNEALVEKMVNGGMKEVYIPNTLYTLSEGFIENYLQFFKKLSDLPESLNKIIGSSSIDQ